jgi:hypothetical protein
VVRVLLVLAAALVVAACASSASTSARQQKQQKRAPTTVAIFGDSLAWEAERYFAALVQAAGARPLSYDSRGSALCDWLPQMGVAEARFHPQTVELEFSGNALTPCMRADSPGSAAYFAKYRADTLAAIDTFAPHGAHIFLIGAPVSRAQQASDPGWNRLNEQYAAIAAADPGRVTYVNAGAAVESPDHRYAQTLPCLRGEPCLGPTVDGVRSNVVRAPDGVHFCPVEKDPFVGVIGPCPVYSSGAYRYAYAMVAAVAARDGGHGSMASCPRTRPGCRSETPPPAIPATS